MQIKTIQDYYDKIYEMYPTVSKSDIKRILQYGWKSLYLHNSYGGDTLLNKNGFWFYCGNLTNDSIKHFNYYKRKLGLKIRIMYKRLKILWDGYYYFALNQKQYDEYLNLKKSKGRPRKWFKFNKVFLYKIYEECSIKESGCVAIFKIPVIIEKNFTIYKPELKTDKAELVLVRNPLTFQDILLSNNNYLILPKH